MDPTLSNAPPKVKAALLVVKVVFAPKVTLLPKVCTPEVVMVPPLMAVVPVAAFCTTEAAVTAAEKVVVPVELTESAANLLVPPTMPVKVSLPEPEVMVKAYGVVETLLRVPLKVTTPLPELAVVFRVVSAPKVTLLPKVCTPEVVMVVPLMAVVPLAAFCTTEAAVTAAENVVVPVEVREIAANLLVPPTTPVKVSLPEPEVMVSAYGVVEALLSVLAKETVPLPELAVVFSVIAAAKVAASPYDWLPEVVTLPPKETVPPVSVVTEAAVIAALKVVAPVEFTDRAANLLVPPTTPVKVVLAEPLEVVKL